MVVRGAQPQRSLLRGIWSASGDRARPLGWFVGKPSKWSVKLPRNRLRGHVPHKDLANNVMDQNETSGQLPEATSTGRALYGNLRKTSIGTAR